MGTPLCVPTDLETYLGMPSDTINVPRATQILLIAQNWCESVCAPLPSTAFGVVLSIASRGYSNPEGVTQETVGPYSVQRGPGTIYMTKQEKSMLLRLAGVGRAFSIETLSPGVNQVELVSIVGAPTGGTWTLSFAGQLSAPIPWDALASDVQTALDGISFISPGNSVVAGSDGVFTVTFVNAMATTALPLFVGDGSLLTGGTDPEIDVVTLIQGVLAPGQGLATWNYDYYTALPNQAIGES